MDESILEMVVEAGVNGIDRPYLVEFFMHVFRHDHVKADEIKHALKRLEKDGKITRSIIDKRARLFATSMAQKQVVESGSIDAVESRVKRREALLQRVCLYNDDGTLEVSKDGFWRYLRVEQLVAVETLLKYATLKQQIDALSYHLSHPDPTVKYDHPRDIYVKTCKEAGLFEAVLADEALATDDADVMQMFTKVVEDQRVAGQVPDKAQLQSILKRAVEEYLDAVMEQ
jgi:hypothetical protein